MIIVSKYWSLVANDTCRSVSIHRFALNARKAAQGSRLKLPQVGRSVLAMASSSGKLSNPWGKMTENKKARTRYGAQSPFTPLLQEEKEKEYARMEEEEEQEEELVPTCPPPMDSPSAKIPNEAVTMDGIATLLQQQLGPITANINALNAGVQMLDAKYGDLRSAVEKPAEGHGGPHGRHASSSCKNG